MSHCPLSLGLKMYPHYVVLSCLIAHRCEGMVPRYSVVVTDELFSEETGIWYSAQGAKQILSEMGISNAVIANAINYVTTNEG